MNESVQASESMSPDSAWGTTSIDTAVAIRRYMQIQYEIAQLEREKEQLRDALAKELEGKVPMKWHAMVDGKPLLVTHKFKTVVRYDEPLLRERLGERYAEILEVDGVKLRKNRELVRPLLMPVLDRVGSPAAARVENAIRAGTLTVDAFRGAFQKTITPYISVRIETPPPAKPAVDMPFETSSSIKP